MAADPAPESTRRRWLATLGSWFAWEPMRHARWETFLFRAGIAWCAWQTLAGPVSFTTQPRPHGAAVWLDLTFGGNPQVMGVLSPLSGVCLLLYTFRVALPFTLALPTFLSFATGTLLNSQGAINHTNQIVTLVLFVQWIAAVWSATVRRRSPSSEAGLTDDQLAADWTRQAIMSTYVVSAISKLAESHGLWFRDAPYIGLQITKAAGMAKYGVSGPGREVDWLAQPLLDHPWIAVIFVGCALPLELFAFLGLLNRRMALCFGLGLFAFHSTVTEVMNLGFTFHKTLLMVLFVNPVWWLAKAFKGRAMKPAR